MVTSKPHIDFKVKTGRERAIPLTPDLRAELDRARYEANPEVDWIFPSPRDRSRPRKDFKLALYRACDRAGVERVHPHALRHTWASRLAMDGVDRQTLLTVGGWKEGRMLDEIYAHVTDDHVNNVMARAGISSSTPSGTQPPSPLRLVKPPLGEDEVPDVEAAEST
jgi:integrase